MNVEQEEDNKKIITLPPKTILGFSIPVFCIIVLVVFLHFFVLGYCNFLFNSNLTTTTHPLITPLLIVMLLAAILQAIGNKIPILKDIGGGPILCIIFPSILFKVQLFRDSYFSKMQIFMTEKITHLSNDSGIGFNSFFVSSLIIGSFLSMDRNLLKSSFKKFIPLTLLSLITGLLVVGILGGSLTPIQGIDYNSKSSKNGFWDAVFYIFFPLASGGMTAGIIPLQAAYSQTFPKVENIDFQSHIVPALLVGGIFSIFVAGIIKKFFRKTKFSGNGELENINISQSQKKNIAKSSFEKLSYPQLNTGLIAIFTLYIFNILIRDILISTLPEIKKYLPDTIVFIVFTIIIIKLFNLISHYYINCINQASRFITTNFTAALLVILGSTLDISKSLIHLRKPSFIFTCLMCVLSVAFVSGYVGKKLKYYPLEASITAGLCTNSIGGAGNIAILSASDLMGLMPFAQIATRIGGALVVVIASITYPLIYG